MRIPMKCALAVMAFLLTVFMATPAPATMGKAKLHGLITDHHHVTGEIKQIREMSDEALDDEIDKLIRQRTRKQRKQA